MSFDFPASPTTGQVFNAPTGQGYVYSGTAWNLAQTSPQAPVASDVPPANPYAGQLWLRSTTGALYMWYVDPNSSQWIQIPGTNAAPGAWTALGEYSILNQQRITVANLGSYRRLRGVGEFVPLTAGNFLGIRYSADNGVTFDAGASDYGNHQRTLIGASTYTPAASGNSLGFIGSNLVWDVNSGTMFDFVIDFFNQAANTKMLSRGYGGTSGNGTAGSGDCNVQRLSATAHNAIQLVIPSNTMNLNFTLEGVLG